MTEKLRTDELEIAYEVSGPADGTPVLAVHGWPDDPGCWAAVLPGLEAAGCRVYRPYLRGFGPTRFLDPEAPRTGQVGALCGDLRDFVLGNAYPARCTPSF